MTVTRMPRLLGLALTVAAVITALAAALLSTMNSKAVTTQPSPRLLARVSKGPLTSHIYATGTLFLAQPTGAHYTIFEHSTGLLTALPIVGQEVRQGDVLYRVSDQAVVLLDGSTPAYRTLSEGDTGPDVRQLNADLVALGYATRSELSSSADYFGAGTVYALEKLQKRYGLDQTGTLPLGQAVFLPTPILITAVTAPLGTDYPADPPGAGPTARRPEFVDLNLSPTNGKVPPNSNPRCRERTPGKCRHRKHRRHTKPTTPNQNKPPHRPGHAPPSTRHKPGAHPEKHHPSGSGQSHRPGRSSPSRRKPGSAPTTRKPAHPAPKRPGGNPTSPPAQPPARPILQATEIRRQVVVQVDATDLHALKRGQQASITLPDGRQTPGHVVNIGRTVSPTRAVPIYITLQHPGLAGNLDQVPVEAQIKTTTVASALRVPVTALVSTAHATSAVRALTPQGNLQLVPVDTGVFDETDGLVQVTGSLAPGERIVLPGSSPDG